ncbi:MAG: hypothetical protein DRH08_03985 [Deltaproteobacteria bacterium]|nr:MAG: hypothetical protein DRH08_03985 [Deltaproteobacteria bacterium]
MDLVNQRVDEYNADIISELENMYMGRYVTFIGFVTEPGVTKWREQTVLVEKITMSSCYEVHFNDICLHGEVLKVTGDLSTNRITSKDQELYDWLGEYNSELRDICVQQLNAAPANYDLMDICDSVDSRAYDQFCGGEFS